MPRKMVARLALVALVSVPVLTPAAAEAHGRRVVVFGPFGPYGAFGPFGAFGYGPYFGPAYGYGPYGPGFVDDTAAARLLVKPERTEVYVDGYRAGVADDYDGRFQSLRVPAGPHEIALYLDGHKTVREKVYLSTGSTFKLHHTMEPLAPGEPAEPRPTAPSRRKQRRGGEVTDAAPGR